MLRFLFFFAKKTHFHAKLYIRETQLKKKKKHIHEFGKEINELKDNKSDKILIQARFYIEIEISFVE